MNDRAAEQLARLFHETYERLAPDFGYRTREASAKPWEEVPEQNRALMVATAGHVLDVLEPDGEFRSVDPLLQEAWGVIANAAGEGWERESAWREAATRWRDQYHERLDQARKRERDLTDLYLSKADGQRRVWEISIDNGHASIRWDGAPINSVSVNGQEYRNLDGEFGHLKALREAVRRIADRAWANDPLWRRADRVYARDLYWALGDTHTPDGTLIRRETPDGPAEGR